MIGILIQLALSWILVYLTEKKNLGVLGFMPRIERVKDFLLFFIITACCSASGFITGWMVYGIEWNLNPEFSLGLIGEGIWWNVKSVFFEELIFRGVLLYILVKRLGIKTAVLISSIAFGIYHWFSQNAFGDPAQMLITFLVTGIMGLVYATGYTRTFSLYIPVAIHLGWNLVQGVVFSQTVIGSQLLIPDRTSQHIHLPFFASFFIFFFPILSAVLLNLFLLKRKKQLPVP